MMEVTASLGLSKISWCPQHAIQLYNGITACLHEYTCNTGASVTPLLFLRAFWRVVGEEQEASVAVKPVSSSRAQKQVHYLKLLLIFIALWEVNWCQTKRITFKGDRPTEGQLHVVKYRLTTLSRAAKMQDGTLQNVVTVSWAQGNCFTAANCKKV